MSRKTSIPAISTTLAFSAVLAVGSVGWAQDATTEPGGASAVEDSTALSSSIVPDGESLSEADEAAMLEGLATITPDDASAAALAGTPGVVTSVYLEEENGCRGLQRAI